MAKQKGRFQSEFHLGFLVICCLLLLLNFLSNLSLYRAGTQLSVETSSRLRNAAQAVTGQISQAESFDLNEDKQKSILMQYGLNSLYLLPPLPATLSEGAKGEWVAQASKRLSQKSLTEVANKLFAGSPRKLNRGTGNEYYYFLNIESSSGDGLLVLGILSPNLAFVDDMNILLKTLLPGSVLFVILLYLILSRKILSPFRKIREQAARAGRIVKEDDADAIVEDYRMVIESLRNKEIELLRLNEEISGRADRLERMNRYLLESSSSGIISVDNLGTIVEVNNAAHRLLSLNDNAVVGMMYDQLLRNSRELSDMVCSALNESKYSEYNEVELNLPEGKPSTVGVVVSPIKDRSQGIMGVSLLLNDLTELVRLRHNLEQRNRLVSLGEMAGGLAHQIRNSLGAIGGYANLIKRKLRKSDLPEDQIAALLEEADQAEVLIGRFLSFSRPFEYAPVRFNLDSFISDLIDSIEIRNDAVRIFLDRNYSEDTTIVADAPLLKQAITNIIDNGIQAQSGNNQSIEIEIEIDTGDVIFRISDKGCGISSESIEQIFTPFFSSRPSGTGLGLSMAKRIIDLHSGSIEVLSKVGQGTTFVILLNNSAKESPELVSSDKIEQL